MHQVLTDLLRTFELEERDLNEKDPWTAFVQAVYKEVSSITRIQLIMS